MRQRLAKQALCGLALLAFGCSGHDIKLSTGSGAGAGGGDDLGGEVGGSGPSGRAGGGGDSTGGSYSGDVGGRADGPMSETGEAGRSGWIAYDADLDAFGSTGRHIRLATADGACIRPLTDGAAQEKQPAFSADGKQIAFASDSTGIFQIYVMDLANGQRAQMTNEPQGASFPSWSPNGQTIAFVTGDVEDRRNSSSSVMLVDTATKKTSVLTAETEPPYTWSAFDSDTLLLVGNSASLVGIHTDTLAQYDVVPFNSRIPNPASPSISPDRTRYVFSDYCGGQNQLYIARVDGKTGDTCANAMPLASSSDGLISASWGPTGYAAAETTHHDIVLVPSDGTLGIKVLVNTAAPERNPAFAPTSVSINCTR
ncbi:MAG: hypothetical protein WDO69_24900 [Pseudomonadota bacterium]